MTSRLRRRPTRIGPLSNIRRDPGAWTVTLIRRGEYFSDYFSDAVYGGRAKALLAAQHFRDRLLQRIRPDTRVRRRLPRGRSSSTGVVGVSFERHVVDGRVYERFVAAWQDAEHRLNRRRFYVHHHGKERAFALAVEARKTGVARSHSQQLAHQREEARQRLRKARPMPRPVKDARSRKGISMAHRRARRVKRAMHGIERA